MAAEQRSDEPSRRYSEVVKSEEMQLAHKWVIQAEWGRGLWQADFVTYETAQQAMRILAVWSSYRAKINLTFSVSPRRPATNAIASFGAALAEVEALLGGARIEGLTGPATGEVCALWLVADGGSIERFFEAIKYGYLYRHETGKGIALAGHVDLFQTVHNSIRPHEAISMTRPRGTTRRS